MEASRRYPVDENLTEVARDQHAKGVGAVGEAPDQRTEETRERLREQQRTNCHARPLDRLHVEDERRRRDTVADRGQAHRRQEGTVGRALPEEVDCPWGLRQVVSGSRCALVHRATVTAAWGADTLSLAAGRLGY